MPCTPGAYGTGVKLSLSLVALASVLISSATAAPSPPRTLSASASLVGLAADGQRAAFATAPLGAYCGRAGLWNWRSRTVTRFAPIRCAGGTSTGRGSAGLSQAGSRVLWVTYVGGNIREWSLWTATSTSPRPRRLAFVARDVDALPPFLLGEGDASRFGDLLPYAVGRTVVVVSRTGARTTWTTDRPVRALAAKDGELAVASGTLEETIVDVYDARGRILHPAVARVRDLRAVRITGTGLVVQHGRSLSLFGGVAPRVWTLPASSRLTDAHGNLAAYVRGREVHVRRLDNGRDAIVRRTKRAPLAQLESDGLLVADGRRVTLVPMRDVLRRLG